MAVDPLAKPSHELPVVVELLNLFIRHRLAPPRHVALAKHRLHSLDISIVAHPDRIGERTKSSSEILVRIEKRFRNALGNVEDIEATSAPDEERLPNRLVARPRVEVHRRRVKALAVRKILKGVEQYADARRRREVRARALHRVRDDVVLLLDRRIVEEAGRSERVITAAGSLGGHALEFTCEEDVHRHHLAPDPNRVRIVEVVQESRAKDVRSRDAL